MFFRFLNISINNYNYPFYIVVLFYFYRQRCWLVLKRFKGALAVIFEFNSTFLWFLIASQFSVSLRFPYHCFNGYQCTVLPWQHLNCQKWMNVYIIHFEEDLSCIKWLLSNINIIRNLKSRIFLALSTGETKTLHSTCTIWQKRLNIQEAFSLKLCRSKV